MLGVSRSGRVDMNTSHGGCVIARIDPPVRSCETHVIVGIQVFEP